MTDPVAYGARAAAHRLAPRHGPALITDVEVSLHTRDTTDRPDQYLDPISLASLIVSAAALAWTVYTDLKQKTAAPSTEVITRTVRTELRSTRTLTRDDDEIITITVHETVTAITRHPELPQA